MKNNRMLKLCMLFAAITMLCLLFQNTAKIHAANKRYSYPKPEGYEMDAGQSYSVQNDRRVEQFCYGRKQLGTFMIQGEITQETTHNGFAAYKVNNSITFEYIYKGQYHSGDVDSWNINSEKLKNVLNWKLGSNNKTGAIIILKSTDGTNWQAATPPLVDAFSKSNDKKEVIYTVPEDELQGTYYKIFVTYAMKKRVEDRLIDKYDSKRFIEVYEFYVSSDRYDTIKTEQRLYSMPMEVNVFECEKKDGFENGEQMTESTSFGIGSYTSVKIVQDTEFVTGKSKHNGFDSYGISGSTAKILLELNYDLNLIDNGWKVTDSSWGQKENQTVCRVKTGKIGTGALIIQKSSTGKDGDWVTIDKGEYASGLYTTDYGKNFAPQTEKVIYTLSGEDIKNGTYVRIIYAYQVKKMMKSVYCKEQYEFYVCNSELEAVTFHNLSLEGQEEEIYGDMNKNEISVYKHAETLPSGSGTVTGFELNTELNPNVQCIVKRNGKQIEIPKNGKFLLNGRYDILLENGFGDKKEIILYVDRSSTEEALKNYFGDGFIDGKRIFSEGEYPVYEGDLTSYYLAKVSEEYLPISGVIKNINTGEEIVLESSREERTGKLSSPGTYVATLKTGMGGQETTSGDYRVFTFQFSIIAQGTAPGPVVNRRNLLNYNKTNISDVYPIYYGITYQSASKGYITLAFKNKEDAVEYAYSYERGMVETQADGSYRYNGSLNVKQKERYNSEWDLSDAMYFFAEQAVQKAYFDMSIPFTYTTLSEDVLKNTDNFRTLELNQSVIIFADGQKELMQTDDDLPCISEKKYSYIEPGKEGKNVTGWYDFEFIKDKNGYDSYKVQITDSKGKIYDIVYNKGVGGQLRRANCPSGIITITESNIYGDSVSYKAFYICKEDNFTEVSLLYYDQNQENRLILNADNAGLCIEVDAFSIEQVVDQFDSYSLITVSKDGDEIAFFSADQILKNTWVEEGKYTIHVKNRLGYGFSFDVMVRESNYFAITFSGDGTEEIENIVTTTGAREVKLPEIYRYGYELEGFYTEDGILYKNTISQISFVEDVELTAKWKPKSVEIILQDQEGNILEKKVAAYGTNVELDIPTLEKDYEFVEWQRNGKAINNNILKVDDEKQILVQCFAKYVEPEIEKTDSEEQNETSTSKEELTNNTEIIENDDMEETEKESSVFRKIILVIIVIIVIIIVIFLGLACLF